MVTTIISSTLILVCSSFFVIVYGETEWVWSKNNSPHISSSSGGNKNNQNYPNSGQSNLGNNNFGGSSSFPDSPPRPSSFQQQNNNGNNNGALPTGTIRVVNGQGEARLIPGAINFVSNALQAGSGGNGGGGGNGFISVGSGLLSSILSNGPQLASSALNFLLGRAPSSNNNGVTTLPASGSSFPSLNTGGGSNNLPSSSISTSSGGCRCISLNQCFLPSRPNGSCEGGNIMCCQTSSGTRAIFEDGGPAPKKKDSPTKSDKTPLDVRVGLIENIVRGSSTIVDDALDLVLQPFLTEEDKQKLATRVSTYNG